MLSLLRVKIFKRSLLLHGVILTTVFHAVIIQKSLWPAQFKDYYQYAEYILVILNWYAFYKAPRLVYLYLGMLLTDHFMVSVKKEFLLIPMGLFYVLKVFPKFKKKRAKSLAHIYRIYESNPSKAGYVFEEFVHDYFAKLGKKVITFSQACEKGLIPETLSSNIKSANGDGGIDGLVIENGRIYILQTKFRPKSMMTKESIACTREATEMIAHHLETTRFRNYEVMPLLVSIHKGIDNTVKGYLEDYRQRGVPFYMMGESSFR